MNYPKYYGNYLGIVIQNNDPAKRGRVKVFVPHVSPTVYKKWTEVAKDKKFKFLGANVCSDLTDILEDLKKILPWAEIATPLVGESSSGRYNAFLNAASISDSNDVSTAFVNLSNCNTSNELNEYSQNLDNVGEKPGNIYDISYYKLKDAFYDPQETCVNNVNVFSYNYTPECYSNCAKGAFPLLRVGSHVWVFFNSGDPLKPVVFSSSYGTEDWRSIHDIPSSGVTSLSALEDEGIDYPGTYENISQQENAAYDINTETYRNKYVINQKGGTLAFVNTDNREMLKLTHYSGSFKEFNNYTNIELATNNDQKLVLNDSFLTIRGSRNEYTEFDYDLITRGDSYIKIGACNGQAHTEWKEVYKEIAETKQLFDIQRTGSYTSQGGLKYTSPLQAKGGSSDACPVCSKDINTYYVVNNSVDDGFKNEANPSTSDEKGDFPYGKSVTSRGIVPSVKYVGNLGSPQRANALTPISNTVDGSTYGNPSGEIFSKKNKCPYCKGTGKNPGSSGGQWQKDPRKQNLQQLIKSKIKPLAEIEKRMGLGGNQIVQVAKHKFETIGMTMNDFGSIRVDPEGKSYISSVDVGEYGTFYNRSSSPLIEPVHMDDFPGGTYTLTVGNKYNVLVGAGGLSMKSYGQVNISGSITTIAGSQVNIGSDNEVNIDGGKRLSLNADVVSFRQRNKKQIVVEGSLGITHNIRAAGGAHIEGELTVNHITAPSEIKKTEAANVFAAAATDQSNGNGKILGFGVPLYNYATQVSKGGGVTYDTKVAGAPAYIGITDLNNTIGRIPGTAGGAPFVIGYIPVGCVSTQNVAYGYVPNPTGMPTPNTIPIPIFGGIVAAPLGPAEPGAADSPCIFGTGTPNIRGAFGTATDGGSPIPINNATATNLPLVIYGTGRDPDSISIAPHSHLYKSIACTLTDTNFKAREVAMNSGDSPTPAKPVTNAPDDGDSKVSNGIANNLA